MCPPDEDPTASLRIHSYLNILKNLWKQVFFNAFSFGRFGPSKNHIYEITSLLNTDHMLIHDNFLCSHGAKSGNSKRPTSRY